MGRKHTRWGHSQVMISCNTCCLVGLVRATWVCVSFNSIKSLSLDRAETYTDPCDPSRSGETASTAADDDLIELKLARTHVALTGPTRQQLLQLMITWWGRRESRNKTGKRNVIQNEFTKLQKELEVTGHESAWSEEV